MEFTDFFLSQLNGIELKKGRGAAATDQTYKVALAACRARAGIDHPDYSDRVERTLDALSSAGLPPTPEVMCRVAIALVYGKKWEKAAAIFERTVRVVGGLKGSGWDGMEWDGGGGG